MKTENYKSRVGQCALPVFCGVFTYLVFTPLDLVMSNQKYLGFTPKDFALEFILAGLALSIIGTLVMALFRGKLFRFFLCSVCGIILATYVQALFLNNNLGTLDGTELPWTEMKKDMIINGIIWLVLILSQYIASYFLKDTYKTVAFVLALAIAGSQLISCVTLAATSEKADNGIYIVDGEAQYTVSSDKNVIVFSLDTFSKNYMDEILRDYPQTYDEFKDFTYYDNTSGDYTKTFPSLAGLLTGKTYDATELSLDYYKSAWNGDNANKYYDMLHNEGYTVNIFSTVNYIAAQGENLIGKADNVSYCDGIILDMGLIKGIGRLSLFRTVPLCIKPYVWLTTNDINYRVKYDSDAKPLKIDYDFYYGFKDNGLTLTDEKIYSWHHLQGGHEPFKTNEVMEITENVKPVTQVRGYLYAINCYLEEMRNLGVYDDAMIIITTDHGDNDNPFVALMVKLPNQTNETMQISSAPIMHSDVMPTLSYYIGGESIGEGRNISEIAEDEQRQRIFRYFAYDADYKKAEWSGNVGQWNRIANGEDRFNVLYEYTFTGDQNTLCEMMGNKEHRVVALPDSFY